MSSMFLPTVENNPKLEDRWARIIRALRQAGAAAPQIYHLFAFKPEATRHLERFTHAVMRGPSPLSPGLRELIAAFTSKRNGSPFWVGCHAAAAALLGDRALVRAVLEDFRTAPISEKEKLLFAFLELVTDNASHGGDVAELKREGWTDEEIYDAATVCALFCFYNRWGDAAGVQELAPAAARASGKRLAERGYLMTADEAGD